MSVACQLELEAARGLGDVAGRRHLLLAHRACCFCRHLTVLLLLLVLLFAEIIDIHRTDVA